MNKVEGKIEEISTVNHNGKVKKVVRLVMEKKQIAFFEFQGRAISQLSGFNIGDSVKLFFAFNGKNSFKNVAYNNLIGRGIHRISNQ